MAIEIKSRFDGKVLYTAENAQDVRAAVLEAYKSKADLRRADLRRADLRRADLSGADLSGAYLRRAYLSGAYGAAKGINRFAVDDLLILLDQPGRIRAYKLVTADGRSPIHQPRSPSADRCPRSAPRPSRRACRSVAFRAVELDNEDPVARDPVGDAPRQRGDVHTGKDIAAIPVGTDGKFRVHRCKVVGEKDLAEIGLVVAEPEQEKAAA